MGDRQTDARRRHVAARAGEELVFNRRLGANIREARQAAGFTQDELAGLSGLTRSSIANIERGEQMPGLFRLTLISQSLRRELVELVPVESFSPESVADALSGEYSSALQKVRRQAEKQRSHSAGAS